MHTVSDPATLEVMKAEGAVFILFGSKHCEVCQVLRPRLTTKLEKDFPFLRACYIDCEKSPDICAQHEVFSLPAVKVYIEGKLITEDARAFSLGDLMQRVARSYTLWASQRN